MISYQCDTPSVETFGYQLCYSYDETQINVFGHLPLTIVQPSFFAGFYANIPTAFPNDPTIYGPGVGYAACLYDFSLQNGIIADVMTPCLLLQVVSTDTSTPGVSTINFVSGLELPGSFTPTNVVTYLDPGALEYQVPDFPGVLLLFEFPVFTRGDLNNDGTRNLLDVLRILEWGFQPTAPPITCVAAIDIDADGEIQPIPSALELLGYLFQGGPPPAGGVCTSQDDIGLTCQSSACP